MSRKAPMQPKSTRQQYSGMIPDPPSPSRPLTDFPSSLRRLSHAKVRVPLPRHPRRVRRAFIRVKCDLKDLPTLASGSHPPCSNCNERGLNCVYVPSRFASGPSRLTRAQRRVRGSQGR